MSEQNPQAPVSGDSPDVPSTLGQVLETPQAAPAVGQPPDTNTLPPSPQQGGGQAPDYEALFREERERRQGLDRRLQQEQTARQQLAIGLPVGTAFGNTHRYLVDLLTKALPIVAADGEISL